MLDHFFGVPSAAWKRVEVCLFTMWALTKMKNNPLFLDKYLQRFSKFQIAAGSMLSLYLASKFSLLCFLNCRFHLT